MRGTERNNDVNTAKRRRRNTTTKTKTKTKTTTKINWGQVMRNNNCVWGVAISMQ